jgi:1-hydroxycarotenoid 3,4-desaturase
VRPERVIIIGAGIGGLCAALSLAVKGLEVTVVERASTPGGKLRQVWAGGQAIDAGPTVFTLRAVFDALFDEAGENLDHHLTLKPAGILARHTWDGGDGILDLFADQMRSADAIADFAGRTEGLAYLDFCKRSARLYGILENSFIHATKPSLPVLMTRIGLHRVQSLWRINPYQSLWNALCGHFRDPRLRQLFGRYSTYCGASPFQAPATLMLIAHVERQGVWLVEEGMHHIAVVLSRLAERRGARFRYNTAAAEVIAGSGRASGVRLTSGEILPADAVVVNADTAAISAGLLGKAIANSVLRFPPNRRSLSALTWCIEGNAEGFPLSRHTVFFSKDYRAEFNDIFRHAHLPRKPTVYICAQDRDSHGNRGINGSERFLCIANAPATGDTSSLQLPEIERCEMETFALMERCGLKLERKATVITGPAGFEQLFPATGGALYGRVSHGWTASFLRPGQASKIAGLYFAGGTTHPGAGVPMAAISGRLAAQALFLDLASMRKFQKGAMLGGISMPSAATGATD